MDINEIKALIEMVDQSSFSVLELRKDDAELVLKKTVSEEKNVSKKTTSESAISVPDAIVDDGSNALQDEKTLKLDTINVLAPLVGVFYQSSSPEAEPFVTIGQIVQEGDTICIIEAMKILNEIKAPVSGKIMKIHVYNGDVVEFNQILMEIGE